MRRLPPLSTLLSGQVERTTVLGTGFLLKRLVDPSTSRLHWHAFSYAWHGHLARGSRSQPPKPRPVARVSRVAEPQARNLRRTAIPYAEQQEQSPGNGTDIRPVLRSSKHPRATPAAGLSATPLQPVCRTPRGLPGTASARDGQSQAMSARHRNSSGPTTTPFGDL